MFLIYLESNTIIHDPRFADARRCFNPILIKKVNAPGSLEFDMSPYNEHVDEVTQGKRIRVTKDYNRNCIWEGSVQKRKLNFDGTVHITCIGRLAEMADAYIGREIFNSDIVQGEGSFPGAIRSVIDYANRQLPATQQFNLGSCAFEWQKNADGTDYANMATNWERDDCPTLWEALTTNQEGKVQGDAAGLYSDPTGPLAAPYNGIIRPRYSTSSVLTVDILSDGELGNNVIRFGRNLLDLSKEKSIESSYNGIMATYEHRDSVDGEYHIYYWNFTKNGAFMWTEYNNVQPEEFVLWDDAAVQAMNGKKIVRRVDFGRDIEDPSIIPTLAAQELAKAKNPTNEITVSAFDMSLISDEYDLFEVGNYYQLYEDEAGNASVYQLTEMELNLLNPENNRYTFGSKPQTLTGAVKSGALSATQTPEAGPTGWTEETSLGSQSTVGLTATYRMNATARLIELTVAGTITASRSISGATPYYFSNQLPASAVPLGNMITPLGASNGNNHFLRVGVLPGNDRRPFIYTASTITTASEYVAAKILFAY